MPAAFARFSSDCTARVMAERYVDVYQSLMSHHAHPPALQEA